MLLNRKPDHPMDSRVTSMSTPGIAKIRFLYRQLKQQERERKTWALRNNIEKIETNSLDHIPRTGPSSFPGTSR